jgi:hypothetical protein
MEGPGPSLIASDTVSSLFRNSDRDRGGPCGPTFQILVVPSPTYVMESGDLRSPAGDVTWCAFYR